MRPGSRPGQDGHVGLQPEHEGGAVEVVEFVAAERVGRALGHGDPFAASPVVDVGAVRPDRPDGPHADPALVDQRADDPAALPAERAAQRDRHPEVGDHVRHPESLAAGVEMDLVAVAPRLHGDGENGIGSQHEDAL